MCAGMVFKCRATGNVKTLLNDNASPGRVGGGFFFFFFQFSVIHVLNPACIMLQSANLAIKKKKKKKPR